MVLMDELKLADECRVWGAIETVAFNDFYGRFLTERKKARQKLSRFPKGLHRHELAGMQATVSLVQ
jgi:hypothetical protein